MPQIGDQCLLCCSAIKSSNVLIERESEEQDVSGKDDKFQINLTLFCETLKIRNISFLTEDYLGLTFSLCSKCDSDINKTKQLLYEFEVLKRSLSKMRTVMLRLLGSNIEIQLQEKELFDKIRNKILTDLSNLLDVSEYPEMEDNDLVLKLESSDIEADFFEDSISENHYFENIDDIEIETTVNSKNTESLGTQLDSKNENECSTSIELPPPTAKLQQSGIISEPAILRRSGRTNKSPNKHINTPNVSVSTNSRSVEDVWEAYSSIDNVNDDNEETMSKKRKRAVNVPVHTESGQPIEVPPTKSSRKSESNHTETIGENPFKCVHCEQAFAKTSKLESHIQKSHPEYAPFKCTQCKKAFMRKKYLTDHVEWHAKKLKRNADSPIESNVNKSSEIPPTRSREISVSQGGNFHNQKTNAYRIPHPCPHCPQVWRSPGELKEHIRKAHTGEKPFKCAHCEDAAFVNTLQLELHIQKRHQEFAPFTCIYCEKAFVREKFLKQHLVMHTNKTRYTCEVCNKSFKRERQLIIHQKFHDPEKVEELRCKECDKVFSTPHNVELHVKAVHRKSHRFICEICNHGSMTRSEHKRHFMNHTGEKPFVCEECGQSYKVGFQLALHMRRHRGEKPYTCHCGASFTEKHSLRRHSLTHQK